MSARSFVSHAYDPHVPVRRRVSGEPTGHGWTRELLLVLTGLLVYFGVRAATDDALMPVAMGLAVVVAANHYVIDVVVGGLVALSGLAIAVLLTRERERRSRRSSGEAYGDGARWPAPRY